MRKDDVNSYLSFKLGKEVYASHVSKVLNILEMVRVTEVPKTPSFMKGVINLRGMVLPVIDIRLKFGMSETEYTDKTCIVVLELDMDDERVYAGALVDEVVAVVELDNKEIEPQPGIGSKYTSDVIYGMAKNGDKFIMLLDMEKVFSDMELNQIKENFECKELINQ